jgi:hypothetical protein
VSLGDSLGYQPKPSDVSFSNARWDKPSYNKSSVKPGEVLKINIPDGRQESSINARITCFKFKVTNNAIDAGEAIAADFN